MNAKANPVTALPISLAELRDAKQRLRDAKPAEVKFVEEIDGVKYVTYWHPQMGMVTLKQSEQTK